MAISPFGVPVKWKALSSVASLSSGWVAPRPSMKRTHSCVLQSAMTWLLGTVPALAKAMRAVSTLLKLRDCALAANAGMPGSSSQAFSAASVGAAGVSPVLNAVTVLPGLRRIWPSLTTRSPPFRPSAICTWLSPTSTPLRTVCIFTVLSPCTM
ncbi:hypothetical protein G6F40_015664 [Rhizopus arrhizus]|nr:hypothetical protein G6F40_015664 [Rhizopus arrhizus]